MSIEASDIKIYLTGIEADGVNYDGVAEQDNPNLSLGGFRSSTEVNGATQISSGVAASDTAIEVDDISVMPPASAASPAYATINEELISYTARSSTLGSGTLLGVTRGVNGRVAGAHSVGDVVSGVTSQNLFDHIRASENTAGDTEYRCISVLNSHSSDTAFNVRVHLAPVEFAGTADSANPDTGGGGELIDISLIGQFSDDFFNAGTLQIVNGGGLSPTDADNFYTITDYDDATGSFIISGDWNNGIPNSTTEYVATSKKASPNPNNDICFAIERHAFADLGLGGVADSGGVTYLVDVDLIGSGYTSPSHFVGASVLLLTGDGVDGLPKRITAYNPVTGRIDIDGTFINTGVTTGDTYVIVRGPTIVQTSGEGVEPPVGTGNLSSFSTAASLDEALSININGLGEDLIHDELFFIWIKRDVSINGDSYINENIIPVVSFEI
jgi:hypothetical protein